MGPIGYATVTFAGVLAVAWCVTRLLLPHWWRIRFVRWAFAGLTLATALGLADWYFGNSYILAWLMLPIVVAISSSLLFAGITWRALGRFAPAPPTPAPTPAPSPAPRLTRRNALHALTIAMPTGAVAASAAGLLGAQLEQAMPRVRMRHPHLHTDLEGFRILQLTDLHLGVCLQLRDLERLLARAKTEGPDLIVVTGDMADHLDLLGPALDMLRAFRAPHGVVAALGNHEYLRGVRRVLHTFEKRDVELLVERGKSFRVGGADVFVSGANDPVVIDGDISRFMRGSVERAIDGAPKNAFHLLLSHRPDGFVPASDLGLDLTLSGHTHGGQVGLGGRSAFEPFMKDKFLWGPYVRGRSRLYTSAGFGHWLPFRLNCRAEAPVIILERA